jgi:mannose-1-phosphate guanylyltransferase/phosphomannomutase
LTFTKPKPLLPLAGEPTIARLIRKLSHEGIDEIILTTNYFANKLRTALGDGSKYGLPIHHVEEESPLGTAGSVKNSESLIDETFVVVQGDNQFEFHLNDVIQLHRKLGALATMALVQVDNPSEYGIVEMSDGRVTRFLEKPRPEECFSNLVNAGLYVLEPEVLRLVPEGRAFDFSRNLFPIMLQSKMTLAGSRASGFWVDIGDPKSYLKASVWALDQLEPRQTKTEDKIAFQSDTSISEKVTLRGPVYLGKNVRIQKDAVIGPYASVGDESEVLTGARIAFSVIYENTRIGTGAVLDRCVVGENCRIGNRVQVERHAVVGAGADLGESSRISAESKVGPWTFVEPRSTVRGALAALEKWEERISGLLERSHVDLQLTREEAVVCGALCELGEADAKTISQSVGIPSSGIQSILFDLQEKQIANPLGNAPTMFALVREKAQPVS